MTQRYRVGSDSGLDDSFGNILGLQLNSRGLLFVVDGTVQQVLVLDSTGRRVAAIGRKGEGPGEFLSPWNILVDRNDSLFVVDLALSRVSVFDPTFRLARSFRVPTAWGLTTMLELPDGDLLVTGHAGNQGGSMHRLKRDGTLVRTFPVAPGRASPGTLYGYERSLLGGSAAVDGTRLVYANKSPYSVATLTIDGDLVQECRGPAEWTTPPASVVRVQGRVASLDWNRYVHVGQIHVVAPGRYLVVTRNPVRKTLVLDLLDESCRLLSRSEDSTLTSVLAVKGRTLLAVGAREYPEAVVFEVRIVSTPPAN